MTTPRSILLLCTLLATAVGFSQTFTANAGADVLVCVQAINFDTNFTIGGSPTAENGTGPYTYRWYSADSGWSASEILNDTTIANPEVTISTFFMPGPEHNIQLEITDSTGAVALDTMFIQICGQLPVPLGVSVVYAEQGDTIVLRARPSFSCELDSIVWSPQDHLISPPYGDSVIVVVDDLDFNYQYSTQFFGPFGCMGTGDYEPIIADVYPKGVSELGDAGFNLFPNPSSDGRLVIESEFRISEIQVTDVQGRVLIQTTANGQRTELNHDLPSGMYTVSVLTGSQWMKQRLVVDNN